MFLLLDNNIAGYNLFFFFFLFFRNLEQGSSSSKEEKTGDGLLHLAAVQAHRDAHLAQQQQRIRQLQQLLRDSELEMTALREREGSLLQKITELERALQRAEKLGDAAQFEYLKNIIVKYMETPDEHEV